jgi:hypothetical protein
MKKSILFAAVLFGAAAAAQAQSGFKGVGFDSKSNQITARLGLTDFANIELGAGLAFDNSQPVDDNKFGMGISATFLGHLHDWGAVDNYAFGSFVFQKLPQADDNIAVHLIGGLQPEITLMERLAVGLRFGVQMQVAPDFVLATTGEPANIVTGLRFTLLLGGGGGGGSSYGSGSSYTPSSSGSSF